MANRHRITALALVVAFLASMAPGRAENWPQWRGPRLDGTSAETALPVSWSRTENLLWRLELPGPAASTPIVWEDRIFLTSTREDGDELLLLAVSRDGELLWERVADRGSVEVFSFARHETSPASPSPVTDGEHLWALFGTGKLVSFDLDGKLVWETDLAARYGRPNMYFGLGMSPLLNGDRLYLQLLHTDAQLVLALDKATGAEVWKSERPTDARDECLHSYASPVPFGDTVLIHGADYTTAHRMSDGAEVWRFGTLNPADGYNSAYRLVATPVVDGDLVVVPTAKRGPVFGLRPAAAGGAFGWGSDRVTWTLERGTPDVPSPLIHDGLVYLGGERGTLTVLDAGSGDKLYDERVHEGPHRASLVHADGKLFQTGTDGTVSVIRPGRQPELLAKNDLGEYLAASPAVSGGTIYLRTYEALYAIALEGGPGADRPAGGSD